MIPTVMCSSINEEMFVYLFVKDATKIEMGVTVLLGKMKLLI